MNNSERTIFITWQDQEGRGIYPVARLLVRDSFPRFQFQYLEGTKEAKNFEPFLAFPELGRVYKSEDLFPFFLNRIMPKGRPDYSDHVRRLGLEPGAVEPLELLTRSGGLEATERIEIFTRPERDSSTNHYTYHFFARGVRHVPGAEGLIAKLKAADVLSLQKDPTNPSDPLAVLVLKGIGPLGYVPHYLVEDVNKALDGGVEFEVKVERVNQAPAPVHQRLLCLLRVRWESGFRPFDTERFQPLQCAPASLAGATR